MRTLDDTMDALVWLGPGDMVQRSLPMPRLADGQEIALTSSFAYTEADFAQAVELLARGVVQPSADWLEECPLNDGPAAFAELVDDQARAAKIVLTVVAPLVDATDKENHEVHHG